jgi:hypothetical protein
VWLLVVEQTHKKRPPLFIQQKHINKKQVVPFALPVLVYYIIGFYELI